MSSPRRRAPRRSTAAAVLATAVTLCATGGCATEGGARAHQVPRPTGEAAAACRAFHGELPERLDGQERTPWEPASRYTAAWGDPAIELRCGVPRPKVLSPGSEHYNPTSDAAEVNGVSWLIEQFDGGYRFTTTDHAARVEVTVPDAYAPEIGVLTELAAPVRRSIPAR